MASMSRFKIHDEESAPEAAQPILKSTLKSGGQLPNFLGVPIDGSSENSRRLQAVA